MQSKQKKTKSCPFWCDLEDGNSVKKIETMVTQKKKESQKTATLKDSNTFKSISSGRVSLLAPQNPLT